MLFGIKTIKFYRWGFEVVRIKKVKEFKGKPIYIDESFTVNVWRPFLNLYKLMTSTKGRETLVIEYSRDLKIWALSGRVSDEKTAEQRHEEEKEQLAKKHNEEKAAKKAAENAEMRKDLDNTQKYIIERLKKEDKNG